MKMLLRSEGTEQHGADTKGHQQWHIHPTTNGKGGQYETGKDEVYGLPETVGDGRR